MRMEEWQVSLPLPELRSFVRVTGVGVGVADAPSFKSMFSSCQKLLFYLEFQIYLHMGTVFTIFSLILCLQILSIPFCS